MENGRTDRWTTGQYAPDLWWAGIKIRWKESIMIIWSGHYRVYSLKFSLPFIFHLYIIGREQYCCTMYRHLQQYWSHIFIQWSHNTGFFLQIKYSEIHRLWPSSLNNRAFIGKPTTLKFVFINYMSTGLQSKLKDWHLNLLHFFHST